MNFESFKKSYYQAQTAYLHDLLHGTNDYPTRQEALHRLLKTSTKKDPFLMQLRVQTEPRIESLKATLKTGSLPKDKQIMKHTELLKRRDQLAKDEGFDDYKAMMMDFDDVKEIHLKTMLAVFLKKHQKPRQTLMNRYHLTADNFYEILPTIGPTIKEKDPKAFLRKIQKKLDLSLDTQPLTFITDATGATFKTIQPNPKEIQLLTPKIHSLIQLKNFIHELSKSILMLYRLQSSQTTFLRCQKIWGLSRLIEMAIINRVCTRKERRWLTKILMLENAYHSIHALFEFDLPNQKKSASEYYQSLVSEVFDIDDETRWAYEQAMIKTPLTQMMLPLGTIAYQNLSTIHKADKSAKLAFGPWLEDNLLDRIDEVEMNTIL